MKTAEHVYTDATASVEVSGTVFPAKKRREVNRATSLGALYAWVSAVLIVLSLFTGCSSDADKTTDAPKAEATGPELLTGRSAFQKLYISARGWSQDAKPYRLESTVTSDTNGQQGKWAVWRGSFGSVNRTSGKSFTWSGSTATGAPERGVIPGIEDSYSASNASTTTFDMAFLKIDSDQAFAEAQKHGGDKILEKDPSTPVFYVLDWNHNTNQLVWHVIYGSSREAAKLTVAINASTGEFIRVEK